jgi:hypothetical protein
MWLFLAGDIVVLRGRPGLRVIGRYDNRGRPFVLGRSGGDYVDDDDIERCVAHIDWPADVASQREDVIEPIAALRLLMKGNVL